MKTEIDVKLNHYKFSGCISVSYTETREPVFSFDEVIVKSDDDIISLESVKDVALHVRGQTLRVTILEELKNLALFNLSLEKDLVKCEVSNFVFKESDTVHLYNGKICYKMLASQFNLDGNYYIYDTFQWQRVRDGYGDITAEMCPEGWMDRHYYCVHCDAYLLDDLDYVGDGLCRYCSEEEESEKVIIEDYTESHHHDPVFFGSTGFKYSDFVGLGFELEVDTKEEIFNSQNEKTARNLCSSCGLEESEMRYAHDGSLNYGFECISQPHTVKCFWEKQKNWERMLSYLRECGYSSHDTNTCGLHVHVSRGMFGKTEEEQDKAISKVYVFFEENWADLVKVSRRTKFDYCDKNRLSCEEKSKVENKAKSVYSAWKECSKYSGSHYVALNNRNRDTFEYRLGRGTLNPQSFFAWIDLVLTITKNARRITVNKVISNDLLSWLGGIKESTARYIYKRKAFKKAVLELYPSIAWDDCNADTSNEND